MLEIIKPCIGLCIFIFLCWLFSEDRKSVNMKQIFLGLCIQIIFAIAITKLEIVRSLFALFGSGVLALKEATVAGTSFVFGYLGGGDIPYLEKEKADTYIFAFQALPMVVVISAISMVLFYWRILPFIVKHASKVFQKFLGLGGALGVYVTAKIFLGQTEAPLLIKPYLQKFSRGELFTVMTTGMATTSISVMAIYV